MCKCNRQCQHTELAPNSQFTPPTAAHHQATLATYCIYISSRYSLFMFGLGVDMLNMQSEMPSYMQFDARLTEGAHEHTHTYIHIQSLC